MTTKLPLSGADVLPQVPVLSPVELQQQVRDTFRELYNLMEQYAPTWYPEQLRERVKSVLAMLEK